MQIEQLPQRKPGELYPDGPRTLNTRRKDMVRERDGNQCAFKTAGIEHECNGDTRTLQVHHLEGKGYASQVKGKGPETYDHHLNLVSVCPNAHIGDSRKYAKGENGNTRRGETYAQSA